MVDFRHVVPTAFEDHFHLSLWRVWLAFAANFVFTNDLCAWQKNRFEVVARRWGYAS